MAKGKGGFIGHDGLNAPDSPTSVSASGGDTQATVSFTAPSDVGGSAITGYIATSNDGIGATGTSSPITVTGLTNGTSYTFNVWAINAFGYSAPSDASGSVSPAAPIAVFYGGEATGGSSVNTIDYVTIGSTGNATDFGDLTGARRRVAGTGSTTRGLAMGGIDSNANGIDYITYSSTGNASDFGDLLINVDGSMACADSTRSICASGYERAPNYAPTNVIQYVTTASTGNATDFGDMSSENRAQGAGASSPTRGVLGGGQLYGTEYNIIDYITIQSTGNTNDFGDLTVVRSQLGGSSSSTRAVFGGGIDSGTKYDTIDYITISSTGNASDFGDLTVTRNALTGASSETRALFAGGNSDSGGGSVYSDVIDYITISSTGNATDFGNLTVGRYDSGASSSGHGGLS